MSEDRSPRAGLLRPIHSLPLRVGRRLATWLASPRAALLLGEPFFRLLGRRCAVDSIALGGVDSVLVVRLDELGDVVMTTPLLRELRRNLPHAWISLIVKPAIYNLMELCPYVDEVLTYDCNAHGRLWEIQRHWRAGRLARASLWRRRFDLATLPRWDADNSHAAFVAYFSGARHRVGYSEKVITHKRRLNRGFDRLLTVPLLSTSLKHEVERGLDLIRALGGAVTDDRTELWLDRQDRAFAQLVLDDCSVQSDDLIVGVGASGGNSPLKRWPPDRFVQVGRWLSEQYGARILLVGGLLDVDLAREIERGIGSAAISLAGKTTLRQMAALLKRSHLYLGNDTGPTHVAAAMGTPVVAVFGSSCPHRFRPWADDAIVLSAALACGPCADDRHLDRCVTCALEQPRCLLDTTVEQVKTALSNRIASLASTAPAAAGHGGMARC